MAAVPEIIASGAALLARYLKSGDPDDGKLRELSVTDDGLRVVIGASALPTGAATAAKQDTGNTSLGSILSGLSALATQTTLAAILAAVAALKSYKGAVAVTPADGSDLATSPAAGLYVGTGGTVKVDTFAADGVTPSTEVTFTLPDGGMLPIPVTRVYAAGTSALNIVAVY